MVNTNQAKDLIEAHIQTTEVVEVPLIEALGGYWQLIYSLLSQYLLFLIRLWTAMASVIWIVSALIPLQ